MYRLNPKFDIDEFVQQYWQKKPRLIRGAFEDFCSPISPEELAGLACEDHIESRIIKGSSQSTWELEHGT